MSILLKDGAVPDFEGEEEEDYDEELSPEARVGT